MTESIKVIRENLKIDQDRKKSYVNNHRKVLKFEVEDRVFLKLSP